MAAVANSEWAYGSLPCPHCGEWLHAQQDWCLHCGDPARTVIAPAPRWRRLIDVSLPAMAPTLVDNMRITLGWCWTYLIIAEIVAADSGLGFVIWQARRYFKTPEVMAGVIAIGIIGLLTDQIIRQLHRRWFGYLTR